MGVYAEMIVDFWQLFSALTHNYAIMDFLHFLFYLVISAVCAGIAARVVSAKTGKSKDGLPSGFAAMAIVGVIGAWLGGQMIGRVGPTLEGVPLVPTVLGSMIFVLALSILSFLVNKGKTFGKSQKG